MKEQPKVLRYISAKVKNKRINIFLLHNPDGSHSFLLQSKTLQDFKTRNITTTMTNWSVESFSVISGLMEIFLNDPEVKNKIIHRDLAKIERFTASTNLKSVKQWTS